MQRSLDFLLDKFLKRNDERDERDKMHPFLGPLSVAIFGLGTLCQAQASTTTPATPTGTITTSPAKTTEGYFLNDCPNATGAGFALYG